MRSTSALRSTLALAAAATLLLAGLASPAASEPEPDCYQVHLGEHEAGPGTVDASDSCPDVYVDDPTPDGTDCLQVYLSFEVGPASTSWSCGSGGELHVDEDWEPEDELEDTDKPRCYHIYGQAEAGPVTYTMRSSCDHEVTVDEDWEPQDELP